MGALDSEVGEFGDGSSGVDAGRGEVEGESTRSGAAVEEGFVKREGEDVNLGESKGKFLIMVFLVDIGEEDCGQEGVGELVPFLRIG